jgi:hypothetical protein
MRRYALAAIASFCLLTAPPAYAAGSDQFGNVVNTILAQP